MLAYVVAGVVAFAAASSYLLDEHRRHPFGDEKFKAPLLWAGLGLLDVVVAWAVLTGAFALTSTETLDELGGIARGAGIGFLAPLAVRSPLREIRIGDKTERIGFTEVYDHVRVRLNRALDERITMLRRQDQHSVYDAITVNGWDVPAFIARLDEHVEDARRFDAIEKERIRDALRSANTANTKSARLRAMINVALPEHLTSVLEYCQNHEPSNDDRRRGAALLRTWGVTSR